MLEIDNIHVNYGRLQALRGVSITVAEGEVICLVGPNGAGKSTTLAAIAGGVSPHTGSIKLQGRGLVGMPPEAISRLGVSLVPEGRHVFATLGSSDLTYLQASGSVTAGFALDYQDGSLDQHYRSRASDLPLDGVTAIFLKYAGGDTSWRGDVAWEHAPHVPQPIPWYSTWVGYIVILLAVIILIWLWRG